MRLFEYVCDGSVSTTQHLTGQVHRLWGLGHVVEVRHLKAHPVAPTGDLQGALHHLLLEDGSVNSLADFGGMDEAPVPE